MVYRTTKPCYLGVISFTEHQTAQPIECFEIYYGRLFPENVSNNMVQLVVHSQTNIKLEANCVDLRLSHIRNIFLKNK